MALRVSIVKVWLKSLAYPSGKEGGKYFVQMISTCLRYTPRRGGRGSAACVYAPFPCHDPFLHLIVQMQNDDLCLGLHLIISLWSLPDFKCVKLTFFDSPMLHAQTTCTPRPPRWWNTTRGSCWVIRTAHGTTLATPDGSPSWP